MRRLLNFTAILAMAVLSLSNLSVSAQTQNVPNPPGGRGGRGNVSAGPQEIPLWENGAPGALGNADVDKPTITAYRAGGRGAPGACVIIAPGGGYFMLSMESEGRQEAYWFNAMGITAFVLKYRIAPYHYPIELEDAKRAIRLVRSRASDFGVDPTKIGMMGFSAGGHLTATAGTHFDAGNPDTSDPVERVSSRPDFMILAYPVISFQQSVVGNPNVLAAYAGSGKNLLGDNPEPRLLRDLSDELQVTAQTPPTFLVHGTADRLVSVENSVQFYLALRKAGVPAELHTFENGQHGFGMDLRDPAVGEWPTLLINWLRGRGLLTAPNVQLAGNPGFGRD